jgi:hypothetical protein
MCKTKDCMGISLAILVSQSIQVSIQQFRQCYCLSMGTSVATTLASSIGIMSLTSITNFFTV